MEKYIIRDFERVDQKIIEEYARIGVSTVYEAQNKQGLMYHSIKPIINNRTIAGTAVTVNCYAGDNLMIHAAVELCKPGDILVIGVIGEAKCGMIGDLFVNALKKRQVKGVIIDNGIRDVAQIRKMDFPIWTKYVTSTGTTKMKGGWVNSDIVCGGVPISAGDIVIADDDGVVVVKKEDALSSLELSKKREEKEVGTLKKINNGEVSVDFYDLRTILDKEVTYYENKEEKNS